MFLAHSESCKEFARCRRWNYKQRESTTADKSMRSCCVGRVGSPSPERAFNNYYENTWKVNNDTRIYDESENKGDEKIRISRI